MNTENTKTIKAIKKTATEIKKSFAEKSDEVAEIITSSDDISSKERNNQIKSETINAFKGIGTSVKNNIGELTFKGFARDMSFGLGKIIQVANKACKYVIKGFGS